jgi:hypothetical protein
MVERFDMSAVSLKTYHEELVKFTNDFLVTRAGICLEDIIKIVEFVQTTKVASEVTPEETPVVTPVVAPVTETNIASHFVQPRRVGIIGNRKSGVGISDFENYFNRTLRNGTVDVNSFYLEFERQYGHRFTSQDFQVDSKNSCPYWKNKLYNFIHRKRVAGVLYPSSFDRSQLILKSHYKI